MKALLLALSAVEGCLLLAAPARAAVIHGFDVIISPERDSSFQAREKIEFDFGDEQRHGLFREIPLRYRAGPLHFDFRFQVDEVSSDHSRTVTQEQAGRKVRLRIGDPDRTVSGDHFYYIFYTLSRGMLFFPDHDEIYWNVTGNDWLVPIESASLQMDIPLEARFEDLKYTAYTGPAGARGQAYTVTRERSRLVFKTTRRLRPGEGLTVVVGFPKGVFHQPPLWRRILWWFADNWVTFLGFALPLLTLVFMLWTWNRLGVDPDTDAPLVTEYLPPEDLSPAELGTLWDEKADDDDVLSTLLDLAARGFLNIQTTPAGERVFNRLFRPGDLRPHEKEFLGNLFGGAGASQASMSDLKNRRFGALIPLFKDDLYDSLVAKGLFPQDPRQVRSNWLVLALCVGTAGVFLPIATQPEQSLELFAMAGGGILSALVIAAFARIMPRKSAAGARAARRALGFREFVKRAEKERIEWLYRQDPTAFERLLPYAVVLGVGREWAGQFSGLLQAPPSYYEGGAAAFSAPDWFDSMRSDSKTLSAAVPERPAGGGRSTSGDSDSESSWGTSGFSGGSGGWSSGGGGGGGSSGGGGGGGGGGAW